MGEPEVEKIYEGDAMETDLRPVKRAGNGLNRKRALCAGCSENRGQL